MPSWDTFGNLSAIILPEHASKMSGWGAFGKIKAKILQEHACEMTGLETLENLKVKLLPDNASELARWEPFEVLIAFFKATVLLEYYSDLPGGDTFREPEAMTFPEYPG